MIKKILVSVLTALFLTTSSVTEAQQSGTRQILGLTILPIVLMWAQNVV